MFLLTLLNAAKPLPAMGYPGKDWGREVYQGLKVFHSSAPYFEFAGDNSGYGGHTYTKPTNLGIDIISTIVAIEEKHEQPAVGLAHITRVVDGLESLRLYRGIFPEFIKLEEGRPLEENNAGMVRYSAMDSAWLHFGLSVAENYYRKREPELAARLRAFFEKADYGIFVQDGGKRFHHGVTLSIGRPQTVEVWEHLYDNINSEARVMLAYLIADGKLPVSIWDNMFYAWKEVEGLQVADGWNMSAFVEMTGNIYFNEKSLAPKTLGTSHRNYVTACQRIAEKKRLALYGWAPCFNGNDVYTEYGLDRTEVVTPYGAALLTTIDDTRAWENFKKMLRFIPSYGSPSPYPDALDARTGKVLNGRALALDQNLLYHATHKKTVRRLISKTDWYPKAASLIQAVEKKFRQPQKASVKK